MTYKSAMVSFTILSLLGTSINALVGVGVAVLLTPGKNGASGQEHQYPMHIKSL